MGLAIATILIAYISAFMLSNQAFAQATNQGVIHSLAFVIAEPEKLPAAAGELEGIGKALAGEEAQLGKVLEGQQGKCQESDGRQCTEPIPTIR